MAYDNDKNIYNDQQDEKKSKPVSLLGRLRIRSDEDTQPAPFHKRIKIINYLLLICIGIAVLLLVSLFLAPIEEIYHAEGIVRPSQYRNIVAAVDVVQKEKPLVATGEKVKKGQVLMRFSLPELELDIIDTKQEIDNAIGNLELTRARSQTLEKMPLPKELWEINEQLKKAEHQRDYFLKQLQRSSTLFESGDISQQEVDRAQLEYDNALIEYERLAKRYNIIEEGYTQSIIDQSRAEVKQIESKIEVLKQKLSHLEQSYENLTVIRAPEDGTILDLNHRNTIGTINKGDRLVFMSIGDAKMIEIYGIQQNFDKVRVGQRVRYKSKVYDNLRYDYAEGHVLKISQIREPDLKGVTGTNTSDERFYTIYASIDKQPKELALDSSVSSQIILRKEMLFKILFDKD